MNIPTSGPGVPILSAAVYYLSDRVAHYVRSRYVLAPAGDHPRNQDPNYWLVVSSAKGQHHSAACAAYDVAASVRP